MPARYPDRQPKPEVINLDAAYRYIPDPVDLMPGDRQCIRVYRDTGRQCANVIEWWRRADARYCSPRCKTAAREQRDRDNARLAKGGPVT
jgi:hypothetical protein